MSDWLQTVLAAWILLTAFSFYGCAHHGPPDTVRDYEDLPGFGRVAIDTACMLLVILALWVAP